MTTRNYTSTGYHTPTMRYHSKFRAMLQADTFSLDTGIAHAVYLDSLGFLVSVPGRMSRTDVTEVFRSQATKRAS